MNNSLIQLVSVLLLMGSSCTGAIAATELFNQPGNVIDLPNVPVPSPPPETPSNPTDPNARPLRLEIQLNRRRVVLFQGDKSIKTYPIAVGRPGWETPTGNFKVLQKLKNPNWIHPLKRDVVIAGGDPENPLGRYWIGFWTDGKNWIGFHGTPNPGSVGRPASHGCIRMYNKDIEELFSQVSLGTPVKVVQ